MNKKGYTVIELLATIVLISLLIFVVVSLCTGCNYQMVDLNYEFDEARCDYGFEHFVLKVDSWKDYDGEQIQIKSNGKVYLLSANNCYLVKY